MPCRIDQILQGVFICSTIAPDSCQLSLNSANHPVVLILHIAYYIIELQINSEKLGGETMKKLLVIFVCVILMMGCSGNSNKNTTRITLDLKALKTEEGLFKWPGTEYDNGIAETEETIGYVFPVIPYNSQEWFVGSGPTEDTVFDYRNDDNYDQVEYTVYDKNLPVVVEYGDYRGHVICTFMQGKLKMTACYFGSRTEKRDDKMTYDGVKNDPETLYPKLLEELTAIYGEPGNSLENGDFAMTVWESAGSRLSLTKQGTEESMTVAVVTQKLKDQ